VGEEVVGDIESNKTVKRVKKGGDKKVTKK